MATIFRELIANAMKFAQPGRAQRVVISGRTEEKKVVISIEDFGIGIADECRTKLFQPFHRFCTDGAYEGSGMGLAIAARAAHLIGDQFGSRMVASRRALSRSFRLP